MFLMFFLYDIFW